MDVSTPFLTVSQLALVPLVMAIVSLLKNANMSGTNNWLSPITSVVLGVGGAFLVPAPTWQVTILAGLTIGCIAAGVYSGVKNTITPNAS